MDLYIYYAIHNTDAALAARRVRAMQQRLASDYAIATDIKRRPEMRDGRQTWMEIYQNVPAGFEDVIERAAAEEGLAALVHERRHVEYFMDLDACA